MLVFARLDVLLNNLQLHLLQNRAPSVVQLQQASELLTEAAELTQQLSSDLLEKIIVIRQPEALLVFIQNVQASCTAISNKVYEQSLLLKKSELPELKPYTERYGYLLEDTENLLQFIELHFSCYFNTNQKAPLYYQDRYKQELQKNYKLLKPLLEKKFGKQLLSDCCLNYIHCFLQTTTAGSYSYFMITYLDKLTIALKSSIDLTPKGDYSGLEYCLLLMNFNDDQVLHYFIEKLEQGAPREEPTLILQQYWFAQQKLLLQFSNATGTGLDTSKKSLVQVLMQVTEDELYHLHTTEELKPVGNNTEKKTTKGLRFTLPVAQIAILLRLMVEAGLVKVPNHTAFLKDMAFWIQTERTGNISADSLRNKYYTPERNNVEAVKDVLFGMIKNSHNLHA